MQDVASIGQLLDKPWANCDITPAHIVGCAQPEFDALQLAGLKGRHSDRCALPTLDNPTERKRSHAIEKLEDVVPLLFGHEIYNTYPASLLENHRFTQLTAWLDKTTTHDLSKVEISARYSIEVWLFTIRLKTPTAIVHTFGSGCSMSSLPWTEALRRRYITQFTVLSFQKFGSLPPAPQNPTNIECMDSLLGKGGLPHTVLNDAFVDDIASGRQLHAAYPDRLGVDLLVLATRPNAAAKSQIDQHVISPGPAARRVEFEPQRSYRPGHVVSCFETLRARLVGQTIYKRAANHILFGRRRQVQKRHTDYDFRRCRDHLCHRRQRHCLV